MAQDTGDADFYGRGGGRGGRDGKGGRAGREGTGERAIQLLRAWRRRRASVWAPPDRWNDFETGSGTVAYVSLRNPSGHSEASRPTSTGHTSSVGCAVCTLVGSEEVGAVVGSDEGLPVGSAVA